MDEPPERTPLHRAECTFVLPPARRMRAGPPMLNLPSQPGATGAVLLALGACLGAALLLVSRRRLGALGGDAAAAEARVAAVALAVTVAGLPFTIWRVGVDIRETSRFSAEHKRYVGAETKLIDGRLAERVGLVVPRDASYYVAVAPRAHHEIGESLALWLGYALLPRRRVREPELAEWIVTWGATPQRLGLAAGAPRLIGRNRLVEREPVYVARAAP